MPVCCTTSTVFVRLCCVVGLSPSLQISLQIATDDFSSVASSVAEEIALQRPLTTDATDATDFFVSEFAKLGPEGDFTRIFA